MGEPTFAEDLDDLIDEARDLGVSLEVIIAALELKLLALKEESGS
jgi:wyosine [tRNA(Phe)-imidazoG37] synthetase (radical SAM superfamily)